MPKKKNPSPVNPRQNEPAFNRKKLGYRTPDRFKRLVFRRKPIITARPRSLGGHR